LLTLPIPCSLALTAHTGLPGDATRHRRGNGFNDPRRCAQTFAAAVVPLYQPVKVAALP
jgi:hypothetical protein